MFGLFPHIFDPLLVFTKSFKIILNQRMLLNERLSEYIHFFHSHDETQDR